VLPALELSGLAALVAMASDADTDKGRTIGGWGQSVAALRWFGFVIVANWILAIGVALTLEVYVDLGGPPMVTLPL